MDLSKNEPQDPTPAEEADHGQPQNDYVAPQPPEAPQPYQNYPQQPYNQAQPPQGYPTQPVPVQQAPNPYGYPQNPGYQQGYPVNTYGQPVNAYGQPVNAYGQPVYPQQYPYARIPTPGEKLAKESWILGLVGFFILGVVLGGIGLYKAFQAKAQGADATAGFIISSLAIAGHIFWVFVLMAMSASGNRY